MQKSFYKCKRGRRSRRRWNKKEREEKKYLRYEIRTTLCHPQGKTILKLLFYFKPSHRNNFSLYSSSEQYPFEGMYNQRKSTFNYVQNYCFISFFVILINSLLHDKILLLQNITTAAIKCLFGTILMHVEQTSYGSLYFPYALTELHLSK